MATRILITSRSFGGLVREPLEMLLEEGYEIVRVSDKAQLQEENLCKHVRDIDGYIAGLEVIPARVIEAADKLKIIARHGAGVDSVDVDSATKRGIMVTNTPGVNSDSVADLTFGLMLACARLIPKCDRDLRSGAPGKYYGLSLYGKTLGIIGTGQIGSRVAMRAGGFAMKVIAYDIVENEGLKTKFDVQYAALDTLLKESDFVTLHVPINEETRNIINAERLSMMKETAILVNTSRGEAVDEDALFAALKERKIFAAGLDAFRAEPPTGSPLLGLDNVVATNHIGAHTYEAIRGMGMGAVENLLAGLRGQRPKNIVNPEVLG
jgi:D-3-phosphoglycerate dehydrogenase